MLKIGHIEHERRGDDIYFRCTHCNHDETVKNYENGATPKDFVHMPFLKGGKAYYAECRKCRKVSEGFYPNSHLI